MKPDCYLMNHEDAVFFTVRLLWMIETGNNNICVRFFFDIGREMISMIQVVHFALMIEILILLHYIILLKDSPFGHYFLCM